MSELGIQSDNLATLEANAAARPDSVADLTDLADAYADAGRWDDAVRTYRQAIALAPSDAGLQNGLGRAYVGAGDAASAEEALRASIALSPSNPAALFALGVLYEGQGKKEEAGDAYHQYLQVSRDSGQIEEVKKRLARLFPDGGQVKEIERYYENVRWWRFFLVCFVVATFLPPLDLSDVVFGAGLILMALLVWRVTVPAVNILVAVLITWPAPVLAAAWILLNGYDEPLTAPPVVNLLMAFYLVTRFRKFSHLDLSALHRAGTWPDGRAAPPDQAAAANRFAAAGAVLAGISLALAPAVLWTILVAVSPVAAPEWVTWEVVSTVWGLTLTASFISSALGAAALAGKTRRTALAVVGAIGGLVAPLVLLAIYVLAFQGLWWGLFPSPK